MFLAPLIFLFFLQLVTAQLSGPGFVIDKAQLNIDGSSINYPFSFALSGPPNANCFVFLLSDLYSMSSCSVVINNTNWNSPQLIQVVPYSLFSNVTGSQFLPITLRSICNVNSPFHNLEGMLPTVRTGPPGAQASVNGAMNIIPFQQTLPYSFQTPGTFYLLKSPAMTIQGMSSPLTGSSVLVMTGLFVRYGKYLFAVNPTDKLNAIVEMTPEVPQPFRLLTSQTQSSVVYTLNFPDGAAMTIDVVTSTIQGRSLSYLNMVLEVPSTYRGNTRGLLGSYGFDASQTFVTSFDVPYPSSSVYSAANRDPFGSFSLNLLQSFTQSWLVPDSDNINFCQTQCSGTNTVSTLFPFRECGVVNFGFVPRPLLAPSYVVANLGSLSETFQLPPPTNPFANFPIYRPPVNPVFVVNGIDFNRPLVSAPFPRPMPMGFIPILRLPRFRGRMMPPQALPALPRASVLDLNNATNFCTERIQIVPGSSVDPFPFLEACRIDIRRQMNPEDVANFYALQCTRRVSNAALANTVQSNPVVAQTARQLCATYEFGNYTCDRSCSLCSPAGCVACAAANLRLVRGKCVERRPTTVTYAPSVFPSPLPVTIVISLPILQAQASQQQQQSLQTTATVTSVYVTSTSVVTNSAQQQQQQLSLQTTPTPTPTAVYTTYIAQPTPSTQGQHSGSSSDNENYSWSSNSSMNPAYTNMNKTGSMMNLTIGDLLQRTGILSDATDMKAPMFWILIHLIVSAVFLFN